MAQSFKIITKWQLGLRDLGIRPGDVLRRAGLPADLFARENATVSAAEYFRLWNAVEAEAGERPLALEVGQVIATEAFDPALFAAMCSPNLNVAVERLSRFKKLIGPLTLDVEQGSETTTLEVGCLNAPALPASLGTAELVFLVHFARRATRSPIIPAQVTVPVSIGYLDQYADFFGRRVQHGETFRVVFSALDAKRPFLTANAAMWQFFEPVLDQQLAEINQEATTRDRVDAALFEMLPSGRSSVQEVADLLGLSTRSLQRHLRNEGTSFQQVLNETRERLARHYLSHSAMTGAEISFMLGYDDPNSFFRAFRNWTGHTPERLRASLVA